MAGILLSEVLPVLLAWTLLTWLALHFTAYLWVVRQRPFSFPVKK